MKYETITILYDDTCGFCNTCRAYAEHRDRHRLCRFVGMNAPDALSLYIDATGNKLLPNDTIVVIDNALHTYEKFEACLLIGYRMGVWWSMLAHILAIVPHSLGDVGYDLIARHRPLWSRFINH